MPSGWGVKAGMVRVWVAGKTVRSPCYTRAISERFRDKDLIIKRYINLPSLLFLLSLNVVLFFSQMLFTSKSIISAQDSIHYTMMLVWHST